MLNHIVLMGRLTKDPELRTTQQGTNVASFPVAVERDFGEKATDFIEVVAWRKTGEFIKQYFSKGDMIAVTGRLQIRDWTDRDGGKRKAAEVIAERAYFCGGKSAKTAEEQFAPLDEDDDLPF